MHLNIGLGVFIWWWNGIDLLFNWSYSWFSQIFKVWVYFSILRFDLHFALPFVSLSIASTRWFSVSIFIFDSKHPLVRIYETLSSLDVVLPNLISASLIFVGRLSDICVWFYVAAVNDVHLLLNLIKLVEGISNLQRRVSFLHSRHFFTLSFYFLVLLNLEELLLLLQDLLSQFLSAHCAI